MPKFTIMGSTPGDGAAVEANNHKEAFAKFCCLDSSPENFNKILKEISTGPHSWETESQPDSQNPNYIQYGDYEIKLIS
jgi:hypothetical protein